MVNFRNQRKGWVECQSSLSGAGTTNSKRHELLKLNSNYSGVEKIQQLALDSDGFAYLVIDDLGTLLDKGGELTSVALPNWEIGDSITDTTLFLLGSIPMTTDYESIVCYQLSESCIIDVHLFNDEDCILIVLIDRTGHMEDEARVRQSENEKKLMLRYGRKLDKGG